MFHEKVYKLSLNGGMTCPNRDGSLDTRGCIFCSAGGSGDFAASPRLSISRQLAYEKEIVRSKRPVSHFIAYFQAYTNTYAPVSYLKEIYTEALLDPEVIGLSIGTRPDCIDEDIIALIVSLGEQFHKFIWLELGLQTIHEKTARYIRRGYPLSCFTQAVRLLDENRIDIIVHLIIGFPGEDMKSILASIDYINSLPIKGIKLQLLYVLRGTDLASDYEAGCFQVLAMEEYLDTLICCIAHLRPDIVIHRLTGDGPRDLLIAPLWSSNKRTVLNTLHKELKKRHITQGCMYQKGETHA